MKCNILIKKTVDFKRFFAKISKEIFFIVDKSLKKFFLKNFAEYKNFILKKGELDKSLKTFKKIVKILLEKRIDRNSILVSLGGGVCGDISGFVASVFLRGIKFYHIPTTLIAQVDSSIGRKNAINYYSKNILGTFYKPKLILISISFLRSIKNSYFLGGLSEIIKISIINNPNLFFYIKKYINFLLDRNFNLLKIIVYNSIISKIKITNIDINEKSNFRLILNLGHTFSHILEKISNYKLTHGNGVWIGMYVSLLISYLSMKNYSFIISILEIISFTNCINLFFFRNLSLFNFLNLLKLDKKNNNFFINYIFIKKINFVFPKKISYRRFTKIFIKIKKNLFI
ncbi:3-dehydroquinate synthase [Candidatus Vidania fulgoroideorum]